MKLILILEDEFDRIKRFREIISRCRSDIVLKVARSIPEFIAAYRSLDKVPDLICLDHDLFPDSFDDPDPGDGRDASNFLISQKVNAPVLIHSSNSTAADSMLFSMRDARMIAHRIAPIGDDWIESDWCFIVSRMVDGEYTDESSL